MIANGQVVWSGTSESIRADALLRQRYLTVLRAVCAAMHV
jgi:hypothetical protein